MSNTGELHISQTEDGFVFTVPPFLWEPGKQKTFTRQSLAQVVALRDKMIHNNYQPKPTFAPDSPPVGNYYTGIQSYTFGALGDTHLCNIQDRLEAIAAVYEYYHDLGITTVYHTGNYLDGQKFPDEIKVWGMQNQIDYFLKYWPEVPGMVTNFIAGDDHEGWYNQLDGTDIGKTTEGAARLLGRTDLRYLGYMEADDFIRVGDKTVTVRLVHPGGGAAKQVSLKSQQIVDAYEPGEYPDILLVGHFHKAHFLPNYHGVYIIQTGTLVDQTTFMRKRQLRAMLGAWVVTVKVADTGLWWVQAECVPVPTRKWVHRKGFNSEQ